MALKDSLPKDIPNPLLMEDAPIPEPTQTPEPTEPVQEPTPIEEPTAPVEQPMQPKHVGITQDDLKMMLQEVLAGQNKTSENEPVQGPTEEELQAMKDKFMDDFYNDPMGAIKRISDEAVKPYKEKLEQQDKEMEWNGKASKFFETKPDAKEKIQDLIEILNNKPELQNYDDAYDTAYKLANYSNVEKQLNELRELANTPKSIAVEDVLGNEELKNSVIQDYLSKLNSQENPPTLIGKQTGHSPISAGQTPRTIKEATRMAFR
jgi:hypothetical protein